MNEKLAELLLPNLPHRLREIPNPPDKLYLQGVLPPEEHTWLCVVGSRRYTNYGSEVCEKMIEGLRGYPVAVISGLALGIDAIAHRAALAAGLRCVAVPGSGLDPKALYPSSNRQLAEDIVSKGGALLSEFLPDFRATAWSFPQRNRIMAGLSDAVLVVEAERKSGTLITARLATEYNRDVLTIPGSIFSASSAGPHLLIRLGATPITSPSELQEALGLATEGNSAFDGEQRDYSDCTAEEKKIIELLKTPLSRDELLDSLGLPISEANALLSLMELKGFVSESGGEIRLN